MKDGTIKEKENRCAKIVILIMKQMSEKRIVALFKKTYGKEPTENELAQFRPYVEFTRRWNPKNEEE